MNVHYLELFYYVAKFRGIAEAVRGMPYGIQQPALSAQIAQLEDSLGVTLFNRRPFELTASGEKLYDFIEPFFSNLETVAQELRGGIGQQIRIGSSEIVLRDHLPPVVEAVKKRFPGLKLTLREGHQPNLEKLLQAKEIDLAVTMLEKRPPPGICSFRLLKLPLVLIVQKKSRLTSAEELWTQDKIQETLLCLPSTELMVKTFQKALSRRRIDWFPGIELSSLELIHTYVQNGYGIGLSVALPKAQLPRDLRILPLNDFPPVDFGILWYGKPSPLTDAFITALKARAAALEKTGMK